MTPKNLTLSILQEKFGICHFNKNSHIPVWATEKNSFASITLTSDELSIICPEEKIPAGVMFEKNWRAFKVKGPLGFTLTGVVSSLSTPLAEAKISILYVSTYETDYLFVEDKNLERAREILGAFCNIL
jgi:hypothetical protein